jgi:hypothetical protein
VIEVDPADFELTIAGQRIEGITSLSYESAPTDEERAARMLPAGEITLEMRTPFTFSDFVRSTGRQIRPLSLEDFARVWRSASGDALSLASAHFENGYEYAGVARALVAMGEAIALRYRPCLCAPERRPDLVCVHCGEPLPGPAWLRPLAEAAACSVREDWPACVEVLYDAMLEAGFFEGWEFKRHRRGRGNAERARQRRHRAMLRNAFEWAQATCRDPVMVEAVRQARQSLMAQILGRSFRYGLDGGSTYRLVTSDPTVEDRAVEEALRSFGGEQ